MKNQFHQNKIPDYVNRFYNKIKKITVVSKQSSFNNVL